MDLFSLTLKEVCFITSRKHFFFKEKEMENIINLGYTNHLAGNATACKNWCQKGKRMKPPYFLTAVLLVRIYVTDRAQLSSREMLQWLMYLRYAGVEHIYVYDAYVLANETQRNVLAPLIKEEFVTYIDWHHRAFPFSSYYTQIAAYRDCNARWGNDSTWRLASDIDEYPFSPSDMEPGFLKRFISNFNARNKDVSEIYLKNYIFLGKPLSDKRQPFFIGRFLRRTLYPFNDRVKAIYQPMKVGSAGVHHNVMTLGRTIEADSNELRLNHYWGARLQGWGDDTPEIIAMTIIDRTIQPIIKEIKRCNNCTETEDFLYKRRWN